MCRVLIHLVALLGSLVLAGCASINEDAARQLQAEMDSYVGRSADELILARGVPTATAPLSTGGRVLEYAKSTTRISGGHSYTTYNPVFVPNSSGGGTWVSVPSQHASPIHSSERSCKLTFQVGADNLVRSWKAEGNDCRSLARP